MAFQSGTAANSIDLWDKLIAFLTTNPELVAAQEAWQVVKTYTENAQPRVVLKGPGASATDSIYVGLARTDTADTDTKNIRIRGMTGYLPDSTSWNTHINMSPEVRIWLDGSPMKYWFVASGRRFIVVVNMSTVYQMAYAGFFLPYANPLAYPYPMFIGGSSNNYSGSSATPVTSWRTQSNLHAIFPYGPYNTYGDANTYTNAWMLSPTGEWLNVAGVDTTARINIAPRMVNQGDADGTNRWKLYNNYAYSGDRYGWDDIRSRITQNYGGGFALLPFTLIQSAPGIQNFGVLDGLYAAPGVGNASENIIEIDSIDHLVVQNVYRTTTKDYCALRLE